MSLLTYTSMSGLTAEQQATKAIEHLLRRLRNDERLYHLIGMGSESFDLLTEAYASLTGRNLSELRISLSSAGGAA
jgi:hypothetical protein